MLNLKSHLNPEQYTAVAATEGPLLILAGAGSGKTRVITFRIAHLIEDCHVRPENILAVTFTNKAAEQMKERVLGLLRGTRSGNPLICTFHSFCVRVLRRYIEALGYSRDFTIYDEADQLTLVKNILKELGILEERQLTPRSLLSRISAAKNHGDSPPQLYEKAYDPITEKVAVAFDRYETRLKEANALDFDDLLLKTVALLDSHPPALDQLNRQYRYIMVDEYQDTNRAQYELIRQLTRQHQNLCVVGDEDQSIYGWRGADIQNILSFEKDYPRAQVIKLEQNYRSTRIILDAASAVVAHNLARKGKSLWTEEEGGDLIAFYEAPDAEAEALFVAQQILTQQRARPQESAAVLYRTNFQSRLFEEACRRNGIKYSVVGGFSFYERAEIKDVLSYLKLSLNPQDSVSLQRVINTPPRGIGKATLDSLEVNARRQGLSLWDALQAALEQQTLVPRALHALSGFRNLIQDLMKGVQGKTASALIREIIEGSGYVQWLKEEGSAESLSRLENLQELVNAAKESEQRQETLRDFLDHAALVSDTDDFDERARIVLMTMHSAKGLEFPVVFIVGLEEGLFPHSRSMNDEREIEEERRLCYVAMTRARRKLYLTRALMRRFLGGESSDHTKISRFLQEVPAELLQRGPLTAGSAKAAAYTGPTYNTVESIQEFYRQRGKQIDLAPARKSAVSRTGAEFRYGSTVRHPKYGVGTVIRCEGTGEDSKLTISFPGYGLKKLVLKYASLEKL